MAPVRPAWPAPETVCALSSSRAGGVSSAGYSSLNLGAQGGDQPEAVAENRRRFGALLPGPVCWLKQVHGSRLVHLHAQAGGMPEADAAWTDRPNVPCTVLTADCLPVLFCDRKGTCVAAAHAGWRGLAGGVLEATVAGMRAQAPDLLAWIGPGIGCGSYEVGEAFEENFRKHLPWLDGGFVRVNGSVHADLEHIARAILARVGVESIHGGGFCTYTDRERFFSHRRNPSSGRMATTVWLTQV